MVIHPDGVKEEGEYRYSKLYGKFTAHMANGRKINFVHENDNTKSSKKITDKDECFYLGGVPHKALAPNWRDYTA